MGVDSSQQDPHRLGSGSWSRLAVAWAAAAAIELINLGNWWLFVLVIPPMELVLWVVAVWLTVRRIRLLSSRRLVAAGTALLLVAAGVHFTNWGVFHPTSYYLTHQYAFTAVAEQVRDGTLGTRDAYYGEYLPWHLRDLSTTGRVAVVGGQGGEPVVLLPQWVGLRHHAAGYVFFDGEPRSDLYVDLFGTTVRVRSGVELGDGWWYLSPGDR